MNNDVLIVNMIAAVLIIMVFWWFFGSRPEAKGMSAGVPITVLIQNGVYVPALIQVPAGKPITLHFIRKDATACASAVLFPQLNFAYSLPMNQMTEIILPPQKAGEIDFTCQMGMYRGKLLVLE
jgi:plastocyanin domain-containing protein